MKREELYNKLEELIELTTSDKLKNVANFMMSRHKFVNMIQSIIKNSDLQCEIKGDYIGEVVIAQFELEGEVYLAIDCVVRKTKSEDWNTDTIFIPIEYLKKEEEHNKLYTGVKLLSTEIEKEAPKSTLLN